MIDIEKKLKEINLVEFSQIYPNTNGNLKELLGDIPRENLVNYLVFLINYFLDSTKDAHYSEIINSYFEDSESVGQGLIHKYLEYIEIKSNKSIDLFNPYTCLKVLEYVCSNLETFPTSSDIKTGTQKINILLSIFIINEELNKNINKSKRAETLTFKDHINHVIYTNIAIYDVVNFNPIEFIYQSIKGRILFLFLIKNEKYHFHLSEILKLYDCSDIDILTMKIMNIFDRAALVDYSSNYRLQIDNDSKWLTAFIDNFVKPDTYDDSSIDFYQLKNHPILQLDENTYQIMYVKFFFDKLYRSWYFKLNEINNNAPEQFKIKEFRSTFTKEFTEATLCNYIIERVFSTTAQKMTDEQILKRLEEKKLSKKGVTKSVPDFYVRVGDNIFLFEVKDTLLSGAIKSSMSFDDIENSLSNKFNHKTSENKQLRGVPQLVGYISDIINGEYNYSDYEVTENTKIYSILLLSEDIYNSLGINYLVNTWFNEELETLNLDENNRKKIQQLCLINIDTLILLIDPISAGKLSLLSLISLYLNECVNIESNIENIKKIVVPFSAYAHNYLLSKNYDISESIFNTYNKFLEGKL